MKTTLHTLACFCLALLSAHPAHSTPPPDLAIEDLRQLLDQGVRSGSAEIVIPPGVYRGGPLPNAKDHLRLSGVKNTVIRAVGVTLFCTDPTRAITLQNCSQVTIEGLTIDYDPLPFTQGDIVDGDAQAGWIDIKIHAGYPLRAQSRIDVVDRETRFRKIGSPFMWGTNAEIRPDGIVRVTGSKAAANFAKVGDLASLGSDLDAATPHTLVLDDCDHITLKNVTIFSSNCMGIVAGGGEGGHHFTGCRIVPGPTPPGATEPRILSTNADAILTSSLRQGVLTEDCEIRDAGDDSWSVQSSDYVILHRDAATFYLSSRATSRLKVGHRLQAALGAPIATLTQVATTSLDAPAIPEEIRLKVKNAPAYNFWRLNSRKVTRVTVTGEVPWQPGDSIYDLDAQGNGFVFRNNIVRSPGRILIKASGLIDGNRIENANGIMVHPEVKFPAAAGLAQVIIRNNTLVDCHQTNNTGTHPAGVISVISLERRDLVRAAGTFGEILIENNTIEGGNGVGVSVTSAKSVTLRDNRFVRPHHVKPDPTGSAHGADNSALVWLARCDSVTLTGNTATHTGPFLGKPLSTSRDVGKVTGDITLLPKDSPPTALP
jgi:hypothetical protein